MKNHHGNNTQGPGGPLRIAKNSQARGAGQRISPPISSFQSPVPAASRAGPARYRIFGDVHKSERRTTDPATNYSRRTFLDLGKSCISHKIL